MEKKELTKNSPDARAGIGAWKIIRIYLSALRLLHSGLGVPRIIAAYLFVVFAVLSLLFTIRVPVSSDFLPPTGAAKAQSRAITGFMMIINVVVYGIIMNWRKGGVILTTIRVALIGLILYLDTFLIRIIYILIRDGTLF